MAKGEAVQAIRRLEADGIVTFDRARLNYKLTKKGRAAAAEVGERAAFPEEPPPPKPPKPTRQKKAPPPEPEPPAPKEAVPPRTPDEGVRRSDGLLADEGPGDTPPSPGEAFVVYRLGRKGTEKLAGNAANAEGVATHMIRTEDSMTQAGDTVHAFRVVVN
ncbi:unnamed protein product, partial [marine sediment metagenome]